PSWPAESQTPRSKATKRPTSCCAKFMIAACHGPAKRVRTRGQRPQRLQAELLEGVVVFDDLAPADTERVELQKPWVVVWSLFAGPRVAKISGTRNASRINTCLQRPFHTRSEEHTSELQSRGHLVCRL